MNNDIKRAAALLNEADGVLISAGAGMGVDSGLPDFRGNSGFWKAYPALRGESFYDCANLQQFMGDLRRGWGFYGHRLNMYRETTPGKSYEMLRRIVEDKSHFVFTTNVDGHFLRAGFTDVVEHHGTIHVLQCSHEKRHVWSASGFHPIIDPKTLRLVNEIPFCVLCEEPARPNILMFGDRDFNHYESGLAFGQMVEWYKSRRFIVGIEIGAGKDIPTARKISDNYTKALIRINPRHPNVSGEHDVSLQMGGQKALEAICEELGVSLPEKTLTIL